MLEMSQIRIVTEKDPICPSCGSKNISPRGFHDLRFVTYRRYSCKDCGISFRAGIEIPRTNYSKTIVRFACEAALEGKKFREISANIENQTGIRIPDWTLNRWVLKYTNYERRRKTRCVRKGSLLRI